MGLFVLQRVGRSILTLWLVVSIVFVVLRLSGDPALTMLGPDATPEGMAAFRNQFGLDDSIVTQYLRYFTSIISGDLGESMQYGRPVTDLFRMRVGATLELAAVAVAIAVLVGIPAGVVAAMKRNSVWDRATMFGVLAGQSAPGFFIGILLIFLFSMRLGWLPSSGRGSYEQLVMPALTLATGLLAGLARMTRSSVLEVSNAEYIRTARAKGLLKRQVLTWHILRNAALPVVTMFGMWVAGIIGGAAVIETVFAWPGVGRLIVEAVSRRDFPVVQSIILMVAGTVVTTNLLVDLAYGWLDPRISVAGR